MIDHVKYDEIHVTTLSSNSKYVNDAIESLNDKIRQAINRLIGESYDIIDIKQDVTSPADVPNYAYKQCYAIATIYYSKPKTIKKYGVNK